MNKKDILEKIKAAGYLLTEKLIRNKYGEDDEEDDDYISNPVIEIRIGFRNKNRLYNILCDMGQAYCCGIHEIGNFYVDKEVFSIITREEALFLIKPYFEDMLPETSGERILKYMAFVDKSDHSEFFEELLTKYFSDRFEFVRQFKNANTGNNIRMYLENI